MPYFYVAQQLGVTVNLPNFPIIPAKALTNGLKDFGRRLCNGACLRQNGGYGVFRADAQRVTSMAGDVFFVSEKMRDIAIPVFYR